GVAASGAAPAELHKLADAILAKRNADGGWSQRDGYPTDAYATGMALWALTETGILTPKQLAQDKGVAYLLRTQAPDGSWHVASRATKFQIYFESGFPHGHDQWISTMATGWATSALSLAIDRK